MRAEEDGARSENTDTTGDGGAEQPVVVSIYVLIAMAGEAIFIFWLLTPLFARLLA